MSNHARQMSKCPCMYFSSMSSLQEGHMTMSLETTNDISRASSASTAIRSSGSSSSKVITSISGWGTRDCDETGVNSSRLERQFPVVPDPGLDPDETEGYLLSSVDDVAVPPNFWPIPLNTLIERGEIFFGDFLFGDTPVFLKKSSRVFLGGVTCFLADFPPPAAVVFFVFFCPYPSGSLTFSKFPGIMKTFYLSESFKTTPTRVLMLFPPPIIRSRCSVRGSLHVSEERTFVFARSSASPPVLFVKTHFVVKTVVNRDASTACLVDSVHMVLEVRAVSIAITIPFFDEQECVNHFML